MLLVVVSYPFRIEPKYVFLQALIQWVTREYSGGQLPVPENISLMSLIVLSL